MEVFLPVSLLEDTPTLIEIQNQTYILSKDQNNSPILFSASCPHQNNVVKDLHTEIWRCPSHDWKFNPNTGQSINAPQACLTRIPIKLQGNLLLVDLPESHDTPIQSTSKDKILPKITVVGSASLLIEWNGFNILTDPWIEGTAVFDSWINYPPSGLGVEDLPNIDAIWISHEHSDHFNKYSLSLFDKSIPIYVPDFDDNRMENLIRKIGFQNVTSMPHGKLFSLTNDINAISFASGSFWNDNILFLQLGGFTILNVNDAGFNWSIPKIIGKVDMICSQFSPASGYPATWTHIPYQKKQELMYDRNLGILKMMKQIVDLCNADYLLPFANFNELVQAEHRKYVEMQPKNRLDTVVDFFRNHNVTVIDLLPGESWIGPENKFLRKSDRTKFFQQEYLFNYLDKKFESIRRKKIEKLNISHEKIYNYFKEFNNSKLVHEIGSYSICFIVRLNTEELYGLIKFENGVISYAPQNKICEADMIMNSPGNIVQEIIENDLSWDEISSGYWSTFSRNPDTYNVALWKLLHAPWKARTNNPNNCNQYLDINTTSIADVLEKFGKPALNVFEKFGLYCAGCEASLGEKIIDGCRFHGLSSHQTKNLVNELNKIMKNNNSC